MWKYKDKYYKIIEESKIKLAGDWVDVVIYKCLYFNPDGMTWVRLKDEFYNLFKKNDD